MASDQVSEILGKRGREEEEKDSHEEPPAKLPGSSSLRSAGSLPAVNSIPNDHAATKLMAARSEDRGMKQTMEDVSVLNLDARNEEQVEARTNVRMCFAGIFDGHGGRNVAAMAAELLHSKTLESGLKQLSDGLACSQDNAKTKLDVKAAKAAIVKGHQATDTIVLEQCSKHNWLDGACAVACWLVENTLLVANVGDAKAVLGRVADKDAGNLKAGQVRALTLSKDHLALYTAERSRIEKAGGFVSADGRLNGRMQVSRSFGDAALKKVGCSCVPDITAFELTPRDQILLMACDGFWTVFEPQGAIDMALKLLREGKEVKAVTDRLLNEAIRERKCKDNCTIILLQFVRNSQPQV